MDGQGPPNVGDAPYKPLTQHVTELKADLEAARLEVRAARERALEKQRIEFNADRIEESFHPGEMVPRYDTLTIVSRRRAKLTVGALSMSSVRSLS